MSVVSIHLGCRSRIYRSRMHIYSFLPLSFYTPKLTHLSPARTQTTLLFAQCVYLMFAGVYVAKEAIEHIMLSGGHSHANSQSQSPASAAFNASTGVITRGLGLYGAGEMGIDGHHHHWGDEQPEMLGCVGVFCVGLSARLMDDIFSFALGSCLVFIILQTPLPARPRYPRPPFASCNLRCV